MSIGTFVSSSIQLLNDGRYDTALSLACSAIDATSAKRFPHEKHNNKRYKLFLKQNMVTVTTFGMPGIVAGGIRIKCLNIPRLKTDNEGMAGIEEIIYCIIRCGLIHQCDIEDNIEFTERTMLGDFENKFKIPYAIIMGLVMAVVLSTENKNETMPMTHTISVKDQDIDLNSLWGQVELCV
jgi:hypothetical protein